MTPDDAFSLAETLDRQGRVGEAEAVYRKLATAEPTRFRALVRLGMLLEREGRVPPAIQAYEEAIRRNPGHAFAFTRRTVLKLRQAWGPPRSPRPPEPGRPRVTMSTLGANGRFGNQLLQYGFLRMYGAEHGLAVEAPDWIGRDLFDLDDPLPSAALPIASEETCDLCASLNREIPDVFADRDLWGYCCYATHRLQRYRTMFRELFQPGARAGAVVREAMARIRARGHTLVALHLRRGDFGYGRFWVAPERWYLDWLAAEWPRLERPILYIATDDPAVVGAFAPYKPVHAAELGVAIPGAEFYPDFHILMHADALAISNSSFSFAAAMLNGRATSFMRPDRDRQSLVPFDPWNADVLL
ncbi:MAG: tetratricopeptide repeat protein [Rhodospirillales bacterium]|nr:tetratricopeptide repeat protein [Rhodospirillales bacterium]